MLRNYLLTAWRHLFKQRGYALINLAGLAVGLASFVLISLFVWHELSYDDYHSRSDRIVRFARDYLPVDGRPEAHIATMPSIAGPLLRDDFPQILSMTRIGICGAADAGALMSTDTGTAFYEPGFAVADNEAFEIFDFEWLAGDPETALIEPFTVVLTESTALKYFGETDVLGRQLFVENNLPVDVTGVIAGLPDNTHLSFAMLVSINFGPAVAGPNFLRSWSDDCFHTYGLLAEGTDIDVIQSQSGEFFERHLGEGASRFADFTVQAMPDIHLGSDRAQEMRPPGSMTTIWMFSAIALLVLVLACVNFVNLATARATLRAKEVGVRKAVGGSRGELVTQFIGESMLLTIAGVALAAVLVSLILPEFSAFVRKAIVFEPLGSAGSLGFILALTLAVGVVSGSYPALYLSAFRPARVLRGDLSRGTSGATLRKILVVGQFAISVGLIIAAMTVYAQMTFARNIELGYNKDQIVVMTGSPTMGLGSQWDVLKSEWLSHPEVVAVTASAIVPGRANDNFVGLTVEGGPPEPVSLSLMPIEFDFFETYEIGLLAGRTFSEDFGADRVENNPGDGNNPFAGGQARSLTLVLNESAARLFAPSPEEAVGLSLGGAEVIGVVEDIYLESVHNAIEPTVYRTVPVLQPIRFQPIREASIRVTGNDMQGTLEHIDSTWREFAADQPIMRRFLSQDIDSLYEEEQRQAGMLLFFSLLAIFIACLGLLGLALFATEQRTKEIGIRKVMGGTVWDISRLFVTEFGLLVLIASLIAWPVAYFTLSRWLENFAYRIDLGLTPFIASTAITLVLACLTVAGATIRAAMSKPVDTLRYE